MSILTKSGRAAIAKAIKDQALHLAWGTGNGSWTTPPSESINATALLNEVGRRIATSVDYVVPDAAGAIEVAGVGKLTISATPTNQLFVRTAFDYADGGTATIREIGLFMGCTTNPALPIGQRYFLPADIVTPGILLQLENRAPVTRNSGTKETIEILINI